MSRYTRAPSKWVRRACARAFTTAPPRVQYVALAHQYRHQEPELARLSEYVPSARTAVVVGAWRGPWTYWLSRRCPLVVAVEPQPDLAAFLRRVVSDRVRVEQVALSDHAGDMTLLVPPPRLGGDALAQIVCGDGAGGESPPGEAITVPVRRLDDLRISDVGFVKIDVEGHEMQVLDGGRDTLARDRPVLLVEIEQRHIDAPIEKVFGTVTALGYEGSFLRRGAWVVLDEFDVDRDQRAHSEDIRTREYVNLFLFRPRPSPD